MIVPYQWFIIRDAKKTSFQHTARKGPSRARRKKPLNDLREGKGEGYNVEPSTCDDDNYALVHERIQQEEDPEGSQEPLPEHDQSSPEDNGKRSVGIQVDIKLSVVSVGL